MIHPRYSQFPEYQSRTTHSLAKIQHFQHQRSSDSLVLYHFHNVSLHHFATMHPDHQQMSTFQHYLQPSAQTSVRFTLFSLPTPPSQLPFHRYHITSINRRLPNQSVSVRSVRLVEVNSSLTPRAVDSISREVAGFHMLYAYQ